MIIDSGEFLDVPSTRAPFAGHQVLLDGYQALGEEAVVACLDAQREYVLAVRQNTLAACVLALFEQNTNEVSNVIESADVWVHTFRADSSAR